MERPLRIAMFLGTFPVISETFIIRQICGLLELGHQVDIYADTRSSNSAAQQPEVETHKLLERAYFMDLPLASAPWELPLGPLTGKTWIPGESRPRSNFVRAMRALPVLLKCASSHPRLTLTTLSKEQYGFQANSLSVLYRLHRLVSLQRQYDVLHAHFGPNANSFRFARELWHAPLIVSFHGYDITTVPRKQGLHVYHKLFQMTDLLTVNSEFSRSRLIPLGAPVAKTQTLPVGLHPDEFPFQERTLTPGDPIRILSIGRLVPVKGHRFAINAFRQVLQKHPNTRYEIVGDGPERSTLEIAIKEMGLSAKVILHGALAGKTLKQIMEQAHVFLFPSVSTEGDAEGQGLALQEAQAAGLPVIATHHGALPEGMLPEKSGFLVPENDVAALADRLSYLVEHPEIWPMLGRNGREFVSARYDIRQLNRQLAGLYAKAIQTCDFNK
jgi:colanic acid/amylovoran biosynthesis glycosyltransferase